ncbi:MAG: hypothetical protein JWN23_2705 [Rhodocyclales bacterium]|nr:hypothetical protein [Rhodocyclales bacterium]
MSTHPFFAHDIQVEICSEAHVKLQVVDVPFLDEIPNFSDHLSSRRRPSHRLSIDRSIAPQIRANDAL